MKLRNPWLIGLAALLGAVLVRVWMSTVRYRYRLHGQQVHPDDPDLPGRFIYAIWHETMLFPAGRRYRGKFHALVSQHADGELIARIVQHLGYHTVRGSTTRGGSAALMEMVEKGISSHLLVTPDGPRGPRRRVQPGVIYMASRTGLPIVPVGIAFSRCWRARSWDRFAIPLPWSKGLAVAGPVVHVPPHLGREDLEAYRIRVEQGLLQATAEAEEAVQGSRRKANGLPRSGLPILLGGRRLGDRADRAADGR
jgi:hypothetical protein